MIERAKDIKGLYRKGLRKKLGDNFSGMGVGYKFVDGKKTDEICLQVYVKKKLPIDDLPPGQKIPSKILDVKTDIIEGTFKAFSYRTEKQRPAPPGVSIGHHDITAGTFGFKAGNYIVSNNHVLAYANQALLNDSILQPGPVDGGVDPTDRIGALFDFEPLIMWNWATYNNIMDAAIALPDSQSDISDVIYEIGAPTGYVDLELGNTVKKSGRTTGVTTGEVTSIDWEGTVSYGYYGNYEATFYDQILIYNASLMAQGGDSGSAVIKEDGADILIGALLFAGSGDTLAICSPIAPIVTRFGLDGTKPSRLAEYYRGDATDNVSYESASGNRIIAQTFTPTYECLVSHVTLFLARQGSPGTVTVSLRATDINGHATGPDLCSGTVNGNTLPLYSANLYPSQVAMIGDCTVKPGTQYAIVISAPSGDGSNHAYIWCNTTPENVYTGGTAEYSNNNGGDWTTDAADCWFEIWGYRGIYLFAEDGLKIGDESSLYPLTHVVQKQITQNTDDAAINTSISTIFLNTLLIGNNGDGLNVIRAGVRFQDITTESKAIITSAYLAFTSKGNYTNDTVRLRIWGEQNNAAAAFSTYADFIARSKTTHYVDWEFTTNWVTDGVYTSPSLVDIIQELVDDYDGLSSADIVLFIDDNSSDNQAGRVPNDYNDAPSKSVTLHIEYLLKPISLHSSTTQRRYKSASFPFFTFPDPAGSGFTSSTGYALQAGLGGEPSTQKETNPTIAEGVKFSETLATLLQTFPDLAEGVKIGDSPSTLLEAFNTLVEGVKLSETLKGQINAFNSLSESVKFSDSPIIGLVLSLILADTFKLSDALTHSYSTNPSVAEGMKIGDNPVSLLSAFNTLAENLKLSDSPAAWINAFNALAEGFKIGDSAVNQLALSLLATEGFKLSDSPSAWINAFNALAEGFNLSDSPSGQINAFNVLTEGLKLSDTPSGQLNAFNVLTENLKLSDSALVKNIINLSLSDGFKLSDQARIFVSIFLALSEGVKLNDIAVVIRLARILTLILSTAPTLTVEALDETPLTIETLNQTLLTIEEKE
ncbi:hypothetical protein M0R72_13030 [Candidatus Pacearchaeota archaeon]|jgi:S1-C subfamily serine protease|nr:hypothetical protein [Candidatus Pacearchaeota archaeon]